MQDKTKRVLVTRVFPRLAPITCISFASDWLLLWMATVILFQRHSIKNRSILCPTYNIASKAHLSRLPCRQLFSLWQNSEVLQSFLPSFADDVQAVLRWARSVRVVCPLHPSSDRWTVHKRRDRQRFQCPDIPVFLVKTWTSLDGSCGQPMEGQTNQDRAEQRLRMSGTFAGSCSETIATL